jgi:hypothetical protein
MGAIVLALTLYVWLIRIFPVFWVTVGVVCTTALYFNISTESLSGLHLDANLYPVLALAAASFAVERNARSGSLILTGLFAGASFVTKQTAGVATTLSLGVILPVIIAARSQPRAGLRALTFLAIGWSVPVLPIGVWLARHGAFADFLSDVFLHGPSSKGSLTSLLERQVHGILSSKYELVSAALALASILFAALLFHFMNGAGDQSRVLSKQRAICAICGFGGVAVALTIWAQHWLGVWPSRLHRFDFLETTPLYLGEFGSLALLMVYGWRFLRRKLNWREEQLLLAAGTSFACAFLFSFSWATSKLMLVPAFPFVATFGLSRLPSGKFASLCKACALILAFVCVTVTAHSKMRVPYSWADWREGDAARAAVVLDFPELRGIQVTPETAIVLQRLVGDIQQYSRPGDPIAEFPTMPILYTLAHRTPMTFAYIHYIDTTPDDIYRTDAQRLKHDPPAVLVLLSRSEAQIKEGEINFRNGQRSGERDLWETLKALSCKYQVVDELQTPMTKQRLEVWSRRQSGPEQSCSGSN